MRAPAWAWARRLELAGAALLALVFLVMTALATSRRITWYLAVDQFGYLRFAHDLLHGQLHHDWAPAQALASLLPPRADMLAQTYIYDHGTLYSRYAPGFPIILAAWIGIFGDAAAHLLNPTIFLALLALLMVMQWEVRRSPWSGTAAGVLVVLCPTLVYLWALTPTRDLSAHLAAFVGMALLLARRRPGMGRIFGAGLALGYAGSIRPDAVLYLVPATVLALGALWGSGLRTIARAGAVGALAVLLGLAPSLAFYGIATGNPFVPTQGVEFDRVFSLRWLGPSEAQAAPLARPPSGPGWHGGTFEKVQGGGFRLRNFTSTWPGNVRKIQQGYGPVLLGLAGWGVLTGLYLHRRFTLAVVSYLLVALPFFSCWTRPDSRYLIGVWLFVPLLVVEGVFGTLELTRLLARRRATTLASALAAMAAMLLALGWVTSRTPSAGTPLPDLTRALVWVTVAAWTVAAVLPRRRLVALAAPALALVMVWVSSDKAWASLASRASFQRPQAERAAAVFRQAVPPNAVVITSEDVGRPMENIEYYGGIHSLYFTDLERWQVPLDRAAMNLIWSHLQPYLLVTQRQREKIRLPKGMYLELVADIPPARNYDYFVAAAFHRGLPMQLLRIRWPGGEKVLRIHDERAAAAAAGAAPSDRSP